MVSAVTGIIATAPATATEGDTITVQVTATGAAGSLGDATADAVITSDTPTDVVDGAQVSFPSASPHTLTVTLGDVTTTHTVEVSPVSVTEAALPTTAAEGEQLPATGADVNPAVLAGVGVLLVLGAAFTVIASRQRHS